MQEQILDALRRGDAAAALDAARGFVAQAPDDPQAQRLLAQALRASGDGKGAREAIERAIALAPDDARLHLEHATLLFGMRDLDAAGQALQATVALDPNEFTAYLMQAQLAMGHGDLDEAGRLLQLAARIAPEHPRLLALQGTLSLGRGGDADEAIRTLNAASKQAPDDPMVLHSLGFAYLARGHLAFAEQAFRRLLEVSPGAHMTRLPIAQALLGQGRVADAADELAALLDGPAAGNPGLQRHAGELELAAGRPERALPRLRAALAALRGEPRTLAAISEAWRRIGDIADARGTLDALLATVPGSDALWRTRLSFEPIGSALEVVERWRRQLPESNAALEAEMAVYARLGRKDEAEAAARRLLEREPGNGRAAMGVIDPLMERDPAEAARHLEALLERTEQLDDRRVVEAWLGLARHRAGDFAAALDAWQQRHAGQAAVRLPLPAATTAPARWPEPAAAAPGMPPTIFLAGLPGSQVERAAQLLSAATSFRDDRFGERPPADGFQDLSAWPRIAGGEVTPDAVAASWRGALPARGIDGAVIDWLPWWDNAYAAVLRASLPGALLLAALRDPRDMLLEWLAFGSPAPFALPSPQAGADWLAAALGQLADLHEQDLVPHRLLRLDDTAGDPPALARQLGEALGFRLPEPRADAFASPGFTAGAWRDYAGALAGPFATLAPVARRLGYPDA